MAGLQAQWNVAGSSTLADDSSIPFNTTINSLSPDITLNTGTGEITIAVAGNYYVSWWIGIDGSPVAPMITFSLELNGTPLSSATSPILSDQLNSSDLVTVVTEPSILTLMNTTGNDVFITSADVKANIVVLRID